MPGPIIISDATTAAGILRPLYRRALIAAYGPGGVYRTDGVATGGDARRQIVCSSLIDDEEQTDRLKGRYVYIATGADAGFQTRVLATGFHGPIGYIETTRPLTEPCPSGIDFELSTWPCEPHLDHKGWNAIVNESLAACTIAYRLALTGNGTRELSLIDEAYIDQDERVDAIFDSTAFQTGQLLELSPYGARIDTSGADRTLVTDYAYADGQLLQVRILRQGHTLIRGNTGTWGASSVGLTADDQAAAVPVAWVVAAGMCKVLQIRIAMIRADTTLTREEKLAELSDIISGLNGLVYWRAAFARIAREQFPKPSPKRRADRPLPVATVANPWSMP